MNKPKEGVRGPAKDGGLPVTVPSPQLLWSADEEKKRQCVFKGKDPQVSPIASRHRGLWWEWAVPCAGWVGVRQLSQGLSWVL